MKRLKLLLIAFISSTLLFGQAQKDIERKGIIDNSPFIFEGKAVKSETVKDFKKGKYYLAYIIDIKNVLRGNLSEGSIELLIEAGTATNTEHVNVLSSILVLVSP